MRQKPALELASSPRFSYRLARLLILHLFSSAEIFLLPTRFVRVATTAWPLWRVVHHNNNRVFRLGALRSKIFKLKKIDLLGQEGPAKREIIIIINNGCLPPQLPGNHSRHKGKQTHTQTLSFGFRLAHAGRALSGEPTRCIQTATHTCAHERRCIRLPCPGVRDD